MGSPDIPHELCITGKWENGGETQVYYFISVPVWYPGFTRQRCIHKNYKCVSEVEMMFPLPCFFMQPMYLVFANAMVFYFQEDRKNDHFTVF